MNRMKVTSKIAFLMVNIAVIVRTFEARYMVGYAISLVAAIWLMHCVTSHNYPFKLKEFTAPTMSNMRVRLILLMAMMVWVFFSQQIAARIGGFVLLAPNIIVFGLITLWIVSHLDEYEEEIDYTF